MSIQLRRPGDDAGRHVELPTAEVGDPLSLQQGLAKGVLGGDVEDLRDPVADVSRPRRGRSRRSRPPRSPGRHRSRTSWSVGGSSGRPASRSRSRSAPTATSSGWVTSRKSMVSSSSSLRPSRSQIGGVHPNESALVGDQARRDARPVERQPGLLLGRSQHLGRRDAPQ